jgi:hypothetical protein
MLNMILKVFYFSLILTFLAGPAEGEETKIIGLADALALAAKNLHDTISDVYAVSIKSEYYTWIYNHNRLKVLDEKKVLYSDLMAIAELHYKSGEMDIQGKAGAEIEYLKVELQYSDARNDIFISENNLIKLLFTGSDIQPESDSLGKYYLEPGRMEMPESDSLTNDYSGFLLQGEYTNLKLLLKKYDDQLAYYGKIYGLSRCLIDAARLRYENEDIEYLDYTGLVNAAIDLKLKYLETLNLYNQAALKIELYINKNLHNEKN